MDIEDVFDKIWEVYGIEINDIKTLLIFIEFTHDIYGDAYSEILDLTEENQRLKDKLYGC